MESILISEEKQKGSKVGEDRRANEERRQSELSDRRHHERRATFEARDLSSQEKDALAQSPEEIRRKLEARKNQTSGGRASFTAKDIKPIVSPGPKGDTSR